MEPGNRACLDSTTWFESLARLSAWVAVGAPIENSLRIANRLSRLTPPSFAPLARAPLCEDDFEALLERAAFETAAVALIGTTLSYRVLERAEASEGEGGVAVQVWLDDGDAVEATAETLALALLRAWLQFMLALTPRNSGQPTGSSHRSA